MASGLINEGLILMLVGMGTVFVFLTILVVAMTLMSKLVLQYQPAPAAAGVTDEEIAAISAAISQHRRS